MSVFKGASTLHEYEECIKRGLCEEHIKEIGQNDLAALKNEFPAKAFKYIRINILYPLLFKKPPKLEKIKLLMEKTPALSKILLEGDVSGAVDTLFLLDSVIIFTLCQLSQICCIGALFHMKKKNSDDSKLKSLQALLLVEQLDKTVVQHLYPKLQDNFSGCDLDIIKASHIITLIFVRNFCTKFNMKTAIENIEKDIKGDEGWKKLKALADDFYQEEMYEEAVQLYISALFQNLYCPELYTRLADCYLNLQNIKAGHLYSYLAFSFKPTSSEACFHLATSLIRQERYPEIIQLITNSSLLNGKHLTMETLHNGDQYILKLNALHEKAEMLFHQQIMDTTYHNFRRPKIVMNKVEPGDKGDCLLVQLVDSDNSTESEDECEVNKKAVQLVDTDDSGENEFVEKISLKNVEERNKSKITGTTKKRRTLSEGIVDVPTNGEIDITKINVYLREASEAILADCGYKAVQIFRGPLKDTLESPRLAVFEECDIVCIKYSCGIAYCKSGGYDDLQCCIPLFKNIIEQHDSITFPAAYYSLGLAYRKLNRFKESLHYLEIVQNFLLKGIHFKVYPWPGMTTVIQETKPDVLKTLVQNLIKECVNPPNPDALCRFKNCDYQPAIYYSDPDFKGYVSLSCSEQCCLQYHFLCWKTIKMEQNLTDKEFLEKACFTPDCAGVIVKIQNIDKKGDLSKEFASDLKKNSKQKWAKWEKKNEHKEKKRKKTNSRPEEIFNGRERRNSNVENVSPCSHSSGSGGLIEEINKSESFEKSNVCEVKDCEVKDCEVDSEKNTNCLSENSTEKMSITAACVNERNEEILSSKPVAESESEVHISECIKNNLYSYMDDFLQLHGPLKVDDRMLQDEISSFPNEAHTIIAEYGSIGEFLKNDLRFAFVGNLYVCVVSDLASAYKMCSSSCLPTDFKSLPSLENANYYKKCNNGITCQNAGLNPDAVEYTPSGGNKTSPKFVSNNSLTQNLNSNSPPFIPKNFETSSKCTSDVFQTSNTQLNTPFLETQIPTNKSKSSEAVLLKNIQDVSRSLFSTLACSEKNDLCDSPELPYKSRMSTDSLNSNSNLNCVYKKDTSIFPESSPKLDKLKFNLLTLLEMYYSEEMTPHHRNIDSYIKPFVIKKQPALSVSGTMTEVELSKSSPAAGMDEQNLILQNKLESSTQRQQQLSAEVLQLQKCLKQMEMQIKEQQIKEQELSKEKKYLLETLTDANETINEQKSLLVREKNSFQKSVDHLTSSLKQTEDKFKNVLDAQEKKFKNIILNLEKDKIELKSRAEFAELQVLYLKRTEYLKKVEEKSAEAVQRQKELTNGLSLISSNVNPVVQSNVKALSAKLLSYVETLTAVKLNFMKKIDEEIEKVKKGTSLKEIAEIEVELPEIPCFPLSANDPVLDRQAFNSSQLTFNFGLNPGTSSHVPSTAANLAPIKDVSVIPKVPLLPTSNVSKVPLLPTPNVSHDIHSVMDPCTSKTMIDAHSEMSTLPSNANSNLELSNGSIDPNGLNSESFKSAMASFNSFASTPYIVPSLDNEFHKKCTVFKHSDPATTISISKDNLDISTLPPGIQPHTVFPASEATVYNNIVPESVAEAVCFSGGKRLDSLDTLPTLKLESVQSASDIEKKKKNNSYEKLLQKLKEKFPLYNQEQLMSYVKEFRVQRQGQSQDRSKTGLSGLPMDTIISEISTLIEKSRQMSLRNVPEPNIVPKSKEPTKSSKVLVNKKLVLDSKPAVVNEQQSVKRKVAWATLDSDLKKNFTGSSDDDCTICCEPMTGGSAYNVSCGHAFHEACIRRWLKNKSTCPICRLLLLLPEEYPSLS